MHDMFDLDRDGEVDSYEQMMEYDFITSLEEEGGPGGSYRRSGSSGKRGTASWIMFFLAIFFGAILPPIGLLLMGIAIVMAIFE